MTTPKKKAHRQHEIPEVLVKYAEALTPAPLTEEQLQDLLRRAGVEEEKDLDESDPPQGEK